MILDQVTKYFAQLRLMNINTFAVIQKVFHLTYAENTGAAFSIFRDKQLLLITLTFMVIVFISALFYKALETNEIWVYKLALAMIIGGALGNMADRIRLHYVIDFFDVRILNFAIFNVADIFVVVGTILLSYCVLFKNVNI